MGSSSCAALIAATTPAAARNLLRIPRWAKRRRTGRRGGGAALGEGGGWVRDRWAIRLQAGFPHSCFSFSRFPSQFLTCSSCVPLVSAAAGRGKPPGSGGGSFGLWWAANPSKRWGEAFFTLYTIVWVMICLGVIVRYQLYESFSELEYFIVGLVSEVPSFVLPLLFVGKADKGKCWKDRYWVKASLWMLIFSNVGNYFWTHYFYRVLGASYTFSSWRMNDVPLATFLPVHVCMLFYHVPSNFTLRRLRHSVADLPRSIKIATEAAWVLALGYFIAYLETLAISGFPHYQFVDRASMFKVGSLFYAIIFFVSFPMYLRVDETPGDAWDLGRVAINALGAAMLVTILLDLCRIFLGPIVPLPDSNQCPQSGLCMIPVTRFLPSVKDP